jgi:hypothetical protein
MGIYEHLIFNQEVILESLITQTLKYDQIFLCEQILATLVTSTRSQIFADNSPDNFFFF